ncbi:hypothetical protein FQR65_LT07708 [Abscondita terminalis]|nr:hypothetical protein FQR65_LT07708 [Abscondita terminalis]
MNYSQFLDQIENLMHTRQMKNIEFLFERPHYQWLVKKKTSVIFLSTKDEYMIRQAMQKINEEQKQQVIKRLLLWLEEHPSANAQKIPEMCAKFLNDAHNVNLVNNTNIVRKHSFRRSLRRLSMLSNRIFPMDSLGATKKSVHFREEPTVFSISY